MLQGKDSIMANPQQQPRDGSERREPNFDRDIAKQAPGRDQKQQNQVNPGEDGQYGTQPENPADLGYDPKQPATQSDKTQAGRMPARQSAKPGRH
jgi:hypothetical protein